MSRSNPNWTEYEDQELRRLVDEHGAKKWSLIASLLKTKGSKQCRRRWKNYLNADLKTGGWSPEEDRILIEGHERFGNKWTEIAKLVGGRTDNAVKNRWAALCKRTQRGLGGSKPAGGATRGRKRWDESESEDESSSSRSPSPAARNTPRTRNQLYNMGQTALQTWPLGALPNLALPMTLQLGPNPGGQAMLAKQPGAVDLQFPGLAGPLDLANPNLQWPLAPLGQVVSPRTRGAQQAQMLALPGAPPGMQEPSPPKRRSRPDLNVIIPAEPPLKDTTLGIHIVDSSFLTPKEMTSAREINQMNIGIHIDFEDPEYPRDDAPLSTSRHAAHLAVCGLAQQSPFGNMRDEAFLPSFDSNVIIDFFSFTPRTARGLAGGATPAAAAAAAAAGAAASPRRASARLGTPRGTATATGSADAGAAAGAAAGPSGSGRTPRGGKNSAGGATVSATTLTESQQGEGIQVTLTEAQRELLKKCLDAAHAQTEALSVRIQAAKGAADGITSPQKPAASTGTGGGGPGARSSPRLNANKDSGTNGSTGSGQQLGNKRSLKVWDLPGAPGGKESGQQSPRDTSAQGTSAKKAKTSASSPAPSGGAGTSKGSGHPGPTGALALNSLGTLGSPMFGPTSLTLGPLSTMRNGAQWQGLQPWPTMSPLGSTRGDFNMGQQQ